MLLKKIIISIFIIVVLWQTISANLQYLSATKQFFPVDRSSNNPPAQNMVSKLLSDVDYISWVLGFRDVWNMFSSVDRYGWVVTVSGMASTNQPIEIELPYSSNSSDWEDSFQNYRESKLFQNLYSNPWLQNTYAQYICRSFQRQNINLDSVVYETSTFSLTNPYQIRTLYPNQGVGRYISPNKCIN